MKSDDITRRASVQPMNAAEMDKLRVQVAPTKEQLERFFYHHYDSSRV